MVVDGSGSVFGAGQPLGFSAGRYQIVRSLGRGGMGEVYLARDTRLGRNVAVKTINPGYLTDPLASRQFVREAEVLAHLDHPNILTIYDSGQDAGVHYLILQLGGVDLAAAMRQHEGPLPLDAILAIALGVGRALAYAHRRGVIHRDLKPANILLGSPDEPQATLEEALTVVKVTDFGLAKLKGAAESGLTQQRSGTPQYMSPEQVLGQSVDERSDLYSFGVLLYEIVTGQQPFQSDVAEGLFYQHLNVAPRAPSSLRPDLPAALDALILNLLEKEPSRRPATAAAALDQLEPIAASLSAVELAPRAGFVAVVAPDAAFGLPGYVQARSALVGRVSELAFLRAQYDSAAAGHGGQVIFVGGDAGVGKTRLVRELGLYARLRGGAFLEGSYPREVATPYAAWIDVLRSGMHGLAHEELAAVVEPYGRELSLILPELGPQLGPFPEPPTRTTEEQRQRLFDAVSQFLAQLAARKPLVVLLDDLQWSSELSLLSTVARRLRDAPALVIGAYREQEFKEQPSLVRQEAELTRARLASQLMLRPLNTQETTQMVANSFGSKAAEHLAERIHRATQGNAFFLEEVVRSLAEQGAIRPTETGWEVVDASRVTVPESVKLVVEERAARLGEETRDTLRRASVLGTEFSLSVLQALCGIDEDTLLDRLESAMAARLIVDRTRGGDERFAFFDDQLQEVLYGGVNSARRRRLHLQAGEAIERFTPQRLEELAYHFESGGNLEKAGSYAYQAGERAERLHNWARAGTFFLQSATAYAAVEGSDAHSRGRVDALIKYLRVAHLTEDPGRLLALLDEAEPLVEALPDPDGKEGGDRLRLARIQFWKGNIHNIRGEYRRAEDYYKLVLPVAPGLGDPELLARPAMALGRGLLFQGRFQSALPYLQQAVPAMAAIGELTQSLFSKGFVGFCLAAQGSFAEGVAEIDAALVQAQEMGNQLVLSVNRMMLGCVYIWGHDLDRACEVLRDCLAASVEAGLQIMIYVGSGWLAWAESRSGNHQSALAGLERLRAVERSLGGQVLFKDWIAATAVEITLNAGKPDEAIELAQDAMSQARASGSIYSEGLALRGWGLALAERDADRWHETEGYLSRSLQLFEEGSARLEAATTHLMWGRLLLDRHDPAVAQRHLEASATQFDSAGLTAKAGEVRHRIAHEV